VEYNLDTTDIVFRENNPAGKEYKIQVTYGPDNTVSESYAKISDSTYYANFEFEDSDKELFEYGVTFTLKQTANGRWNTVNKYTLSSEMVDELIGGIDWGFAFKISYNSATELWDLGVTSRCAARIHDLDTDDWALVDFENYEDGKYVASYFTNSSHTYDITIEKDGVDVAQAIHRFTPSDDEVAFDILFDASTNQVSIHNSTLNDYEYTPIQYGFYSFTDAESIEFEKDDNGDYISTKEYSIAITGDYSMFAFSNKYGAFNWIDGDTQQLDDYTVLSFKLKYEVSEKRFIVYSPSYIDTSDYMMIELYSIDEVEDTESLISAKGLLYARTEDFVSDTFYTQLNNLESGKYKIVLSKYDSDAETYKVVSSKSITIDNEENVNGAFIRVYGANSTELVIDELELMYMQIRGDETFGMKSKEITWNNDTYNLTLYSGSSFYDIWVTDSSNNYANTIGDGYLSDTDGVDENSVVQYMIKINPDFEDIWLNIELRILPVDKNSLLRIALTKSNDDEEPSYFYLDCVDFSTMHFKSVIESIATGTYDVALQQFDGTNDSYITLSNDTLEMVTAEPVEAEYEDEELTLNKIHNSCTSLTHYNAKAESCTEAGNAEYWQCAECGKYYSDSQGENETTLTAITIAAHHTWDSGEIEKAATCYESGTSKFTCTECDEVTYGEITQLTHQLSPVAYKAADCLTDGNNAYYVCDICRDAFTDSGATTPTTAKDQVITATGHDWNNVSAQAATCTATGMKAYRQCKVCNTIEDSDGNPVSSLDSLVTPALDHSFTTKDSGTVAVEATCIAKQQNKVQCDRCDAVSDSVTVEVGTPLGHNFISDAKNASTTLKDAATCTTAATYYVKCTHCDVISNQTDDNTYVSVGDPLGHEFTADLAYVSSAKRSDANCTDASTYYVKCTRCDTVSNEVNDNTYISVGEPLGHTWNDGEVTTPASCESTGVKTYTCNVCQETKTDTVASLGHNTTHVDAVPKTCTEDGNIEYWVCSRCSKKFNSESTGVELLDSDIVVTCAGHINLVHVEAVASTTSSTGNIEYWYCDSCNKYYSDAEATTEIEQSATVTSKLPTYSGGSNNSNTTTVTNPDGSVTETTIDNKTGVTTETTTNTNGIVGTTITNKEGTTTDVSVTIPSTIDTSETLQLPVSMEVADSSDSATEISISVAKDSGSVKVEIPVTDVSSSTTVVLVHEDGTEEILKKTAITDDGILVTLDYGDSTIKIVDNSKWFIDVSDDYWARDNIYYVTSREIFNGTSANTFSPDVDITRGMVAQVIYNMENAPDSETIDSFEDVLTDSWCSDAVNWAAEVGVVAGYGNGMFGPNDNITREQLAVMLWNYAGNEIASNDLIDFSDADTISSYAREAVEWAVSNGIILGTSEDTIDPKGYATRAQMTAMINRFISNILY
jgi:hypothetical protein